VRVFVHLWRFAILEIQEIGAVTLRFVNALFLTQLVERGDLLPVWRACDRTARRPNQFISIDAAPD
jgi:hypothetical protein